MKKLLVMTLAAISMVACMNEEITEMNNGGEISFENAFIDNVTRVGFEQTSDLTAFDVWGFVENGNGVIATIFDGTDVTNNNGVWGYTGDKQYWFPGNNYYFDAVAPANSNNATIEKGAKGLANVAFTNVDGTEDLIFASEDIANVSANQGAVGFVFNHLLSKTKFTFTNAFPGVEITVTDVKMVVPANATYDFVSEAWGPVAGGLELVFGNANVETTNIAAKSTTELLSIPADAAQNYEITFTVNVLMNGEVFYTDTKTSTVTGVALEKGRAYNFAANITPEILNLEEIKFDVVRVEGWDTTAPDVQFPTAMVNGVEYKTLGEALEAAASASENNTPGEPTTVTLVSDTVVDADVTTTFKNNQTVNLDLNGKTITATSNGDDVRAFSNRNMFTVKGGATLTIENGTIEYSHTGENMGWSASTNVFDVTDGGVLNIKNSTIKNLGGSDMAFAIHLNNWGEVTLNVENSTIESTYVAVRVFNSGPHMNNVTIKDSNLTGANYAFWVHNYTAEDFGSEAKAESQKALLNLNVYGNGNKFTPDIDGMRYGFTNAIKSDAYGITRVYSEDGATVTLGTVTENALIRRGVAGAEENTIITKAIVGEGVATLYDRTFRRFKALETVELPSTLTTIGAAGSGVFQSCSALKNIVIPESVTVLGVGTFQECVALESINIPAGVTRIEENCLRNTGLVEVEFHEGVTYFGAQAFRDCKQLKKVVINAPEFTVAPNAFGVMSGALPGTTIYVANPAMKAYLESTLSYKSQFTIVSPDGVETAEELAEAAKKGEEVVMTADITAPLKYSTIYGTPGAVIQKGGVIDGGKHSLHIENPKYEGYAIETYGGTIKNLSITSLVGRGIVISQPTADVYLNNVVVDGPGYAVNTTEHNGKNLYITNSTINGWTSLAGLELATFTGCKLGANTGKYWQGYGYDQDYDRLLRPYISATLENCQFEQGYYIDLSVLANGKVVNINNCKCGDVVVTAENYASYITIEEGNNGSVYINGVQVYSKN